MSESIFHIVDDQKFIDAAARQFEAVSPGIHRYVIPGHKRALKHISNTPVTFEPIRRLKNQLSSNECLAVVFHSLPPRNIGLVDIVHSCAPITWIGWGYDYYDTLLKPYYSDGYFLPLTNASLSDIMRPSPTQTTIRFLKSAVKLILRYPKLRLSPPLERIDFFCPVLPIEYDMAVQANPDFKARYLRWNYQTWLTVDKQHTHSCSGHNILVGNSASPHNNHLDIFEVLRHADVPTNSTIIAPLNYGNPRYAREVIRFGSRLFGDRFVPLHDWMPIDDYFALISSCGTAFFGALRQHAGGNISKLLTMGARVYVNPRSPLFDHYRTLGAHIFSLDPVTSSPNDLAFGQLTSTETEHNNRILLQKRDPELKRTTALVDAMLNHHRRSIHKTLHKPVLC